MLGFAQEESRWSIEVKVSNDQYFYDENSYNHLPSNGVTGFEIIDNVFNFGLGVQSLFKINQNVDIGFGINYSNRNAKAVCYCHICDKAAVVEENKKIDFFKVPVFLRAHLAPSPKNLDPYLLLGAGIRSNFAEEFKNGLKTFQFEGMAGFGVEYAFNDKFAFNVEGIYLHDLDKISKIDYENFRYKGISLQLGLNFSL